MTHAWHDIYRHRVTPAHHLDPRSKMLAGLAFTFTVLFTPHLGPSQSLAYAGLLLASAIAARLPPLLVIKRVLSILPFAILMLVSAVVSRLSLERATEAFLKAILAVAAMAITSMTTPFPDLLRALEQSGSPKIFVMFLAFLYRYAAVLGKEALRLERGWTGRSFGRFWWKEWNRLGHVLAALLMRSYERAERVYAAMLARGFSSDMPNMRLLHFGVSDAVFISAVFLGLFLTYKGRF